MAGSLLHFSFSAGLLPLVFLFPQWWTPHVSVTPSFLWLYMNAVSKPHMYFCVRDIKEPGQSNETGLQLTHPHFSVLPLVFRVGNPLRSGMSHLGIYTTWPQLCWPNPLLFGQVPCGAPRDSLFWVHLPCRTTLAVAKLIEQFLSRWRLRWEAKCLEGLGWLVVFCRRLYGNNPQTRDPGW